jgi:hypothetical protein
VGQHGHPDALLEHAGLLQHALGSGRRPRDRGKQIRSSRWSAAAASAARSARCASPSPRRSPGDQPAGALRHDPARGIAGGHARPRSSSASRPA